MPRAQQHADEPVGPGGYEPPRRARRRAEAPPRRLDGRASSWATGSGGRRVGADQIWTRSLADPAQRAVRGEENARGRGRRVLGLAHACAACSSPANATGTPARRRRVAAARTASSRFAGPSAPTATGRIAPVRTIGASPPCIRSHSTAVSSSVGAVRDHDAAAAARLGDRPRGRCLASASAAPRRPASSRSAGPEAGHRGERRMPEAADEPLGVELRDRHGRAAMAHRPARREHRHLTRHAHAETLSPGCVTGLQVLAGGPAHCYLCGSSAHRAPLFARHAQRPNPAGRLVRHLHTSMTGCGVVFVAWSAASRTTRRLWAISLPSRTWQQRRRGRRRPRRPRRGDPMEPPDEFRARAGGCGNKRCRGLLPGPRRRSAVTSRAAARDTVGGRGSASRHSWRDIPC